MTVARNRVNPSATPDSGGSSKVVGRRYGGVAMDERQRQRRERLIVGALTVFGQQGFHGSTVRDVCKQAALTSRYFYESFDSMEALFEAVYHSVSRELMQHTLAVLQRTPMDPEKLAEAALRAFLEFIRADLCRARVTLIDAQNVGQRTHQISQASNKDFAAIICNIIQLFFPQLDKLGLSAPLIANGLVGANVRMATQWVEDDCAAPLEDVLRNMLAFYQATIEFARRSTQT